MTTHNTTDSKQDAPERIAIESHGGKWLVWLDGQERGIEYVRADLVHIRSREDVGHPRINGWPCVCAECVSKRASLAAVDVNESDKVLLEALRRVRADQDDFWTFYKADPLMAKAADRIEELLKWLSTEQSMHAAWRKRAEECEAAASSPLPAEELPFDDYCAGAGDCRACKGINCTCPHHAPAAEPESLYATCRRVWVCKRCGNCLDHCRHQDESNFHEDLAMPCSVKTPAEPEGEREQWTSDGCGLFRNGAWVTSTAVPEVAATLARKLNERATPPETPSDAAMRAAEEIVAWSARIFPFGSGLPRETRMAQVAAIITRYLGATTPAARFVNAFEDAAKKAHIGFRHNAAWIACDWIECSERRAMVEQLRATTPLPSETAVGGEAHGHVDFVFDKTPCCKVCGLVRPAEGWTRPCKGPSELSLRRSGVES